MRFPFLTSFPFPLVSLALGIVACTAAHPGELLAPSLGSVDAGGPAVSPSLSTIGRAEARVSLGVEVPRNVDAVLPQAQSFPPQNRPVAPFGYGVVRQVLTTSSSDTGEVWCATSFGTGWNCDSVSGGTTCSQTAQKGTLVSCAQTLADDVNETDFAPVACNGNDTGQGGWSPLLTALDWCLIANYMPSRVANTIYQYDDYVRLGTNTLFGGTIFELYGTDKVDRIMQNGGGAVQLSLWGNTPDAPPCSQNPNGQCWFLVSGNANSCNPTAYDSEATCAAANPDPQCTQNTLPGSNPADCCQWSTSDGANVDDCSTSFGCAGNGWSAGGLFNPIQAQSEGCNYGTSADEVTSVAYAGGALTVTKANPYNFTKSDAFAGLTWTQSSLVHGPYAEVSYTMVYDGALSLGSTDQEIPAIFTHAGIGPNVYYYGGTLPYMDAKGPVTQATESVGTNISFMLPGAMMNAPSQVSVSEGWLSTCDTTGTECITVASFSPLSQVIAFGYSAGGTYLGVHGHFPITVGMNVSDQVYLFPYRFDDVVLGHTIREWIYSIHSGTPYGALGYAEPTNGNIDGIVAGGTTVGGWACRMEDPNAVTVQVYAGNPADGGVLIASGTDAVPSEPAVQSACNATGTSLRFQVTIPEAMQSQYAGDAVYVTAAGVATPISNSGTYTIPKVFGLSGLTLKPNDSVTINGASLAYQTDGNLVVYSNAHVALWASNGAPGFEYQACSDGDCTAQFQNDGNFVLYAGTTPYWASGTSKTGTELLFTSSAPYLTILNSTNAVIWASSSTN